MNFFDLFKKKKLVAQFPKELISIFEKQKKLLTGQQITNDALSHQALGNKEKALSLLDSAISQYSYAPAITVKAKMLIADNRNPEAIKWLNHYIKRIEANTENNFPEFPLKELSVEMYEQLGVIYFESYGKFSKAIEYFQKALDKPVLSFPTPELLKSPIYTRLAQIYAIEGLPEEAVKYCKKRLETNNQCESSREILKFMDGFERRPHNLQNVVDVLANKLVLIGHPVAIQMPDPGCTRTIYDSVVPIAFAWICMQHVTKKNDFLSGFEVSLLAQGAVLIISGRNLLDSESLNLQWKMYGADPLLGNWGHNKEERLLLAHKALKDVMNSIPVDDIFNNSQNGKNCLSKWAAKNLKLSEEHSVELINCLNSL